MHMSNWHRFLEVFIPLFVAIDAFGMIPIFVAVTGNMSEKQRRHVAFVAVLAASLISLGFMLIGQAIFQFVGVTEADFRVAGGILLLVLAVLDLVTTGKPAVNEPEIVGIVPLAMPLIAGPATLTTVLVLSRNQEFGYGLTMVSLLVNFLILHGALLFASTLCRIIGINTLRAFSKLVMVLLAAIAVNFIRTGIGAFVAR